jgi:hypothetical protein
MYFFRSRNAFGDKTFPDAKRRERREGKKAQKDGAQVSCSSFDGEGHIHAGRHGRCIYEQDNIFFFTFCRGCLVEFTAARGRAAVHVMQDAADRGKSFFKILLAPTSMSYMRERESTQGRVYYESIKREPKIRGIKKCRCDERLKLKQRNLRASHTLGWSQVAERGFALFFFCFFFHLSGSVVEKIRARILEKPESLSKALRKI